MKKKHYLILIIILVCFLLSGATYIFLNKVKNRSFLIAAQSQMKSISWAFIYYKQDFDLYPYVKNYNSEEIMTYLIKWYIKKEKDSLGKELYLPNLLYSPNSKDTFCYGYNLDANELRIVKQLWNERYKQLSLTSTGLIDLPLAWEVNPRHNDEKIVLLAPSCAVFVCNKKDFYEIKSFVDAELEKMKAQKQPPTNPPIDGTRESHRKISSERVLEK